MALVFQISHTFPPREARRANPSRRPTNALRSFVSLRISEVSSARDRLLHAQQERLAASDERNETNSECPQQVQTVAVLLQDAQLLVPHTDGEDEDAGVG